MSWVDLPFIALPTVWPKVEISMRLIFCVLVMLALQVPVTNAMETTIPDHKLHEADFAYAQQTSLAIFMKAPKAVIRREIGGLLDRLNLEIASFEDSESGYLVVKPMAFTGEFGSQSLDAPGFATSVELEFSVLVYPKSRPPRAPVAKFADFLKGGLASNSIGQMRLDVLCDDPVAVAAGRVKFGEHKYLARFTYNYTTTNSAAKPGAPFKLEMTAYTTKGTDQESRKIVGIGVDLSGLKGQPVAVRKEVLYSAFPAEPAADGKQLSFTNYRLYGRPFLAFLPGGNAAQQATLSFGPAAGGEVLTPAAPFGDGIPIPGSERFPVETRDRMQALLKNATTAGYLLFQPPPVEYEVRPIPVS